MSGEIDHIAATELHLFIDNDGDLYRQQYQPILKNLVTKQAKGVYDKDKAIKLWMYLVESGAKKYVRGSNDVWQWHVIFDVPTRREVARLLNEHFLAESALGAYASLLPKKYQPKAVRHAKARIAGGKKRSLKGTGAWNVYLRGKLIDTVFYNPGANVDNDDVRRSLIDHDGYDPGITVRQRIKQVSGKRRHPGLGVGVVAHRRRKAKVVSHKRHWPDVLPDTPRKKRRGGKQRAATGARLIAAAKAYRDALRGK